MIDAITPYSSAYGSYTTMFQASQQTSDSQQSPQIAADQAQISAFSQFQSAASSFQSAMQGLESLQPSPDGVTPPPPTSDAFQADAQSFVNAYNSVHSSVGGLTGANGPLGGDPVASQFMSDLGQTVQQGSTSSGGPAYLSQIGITTQADGALTLDTTALQAAFAANPTGAATLLGQTAQGLDSFTENYTGGGAISGASQGVQDQMSALNVQQTQDNWAQTYTQQEAAMQYQSMNLLSAQSQMESSLLSQSLGSQPQTSAMDAQSQIDSGIVNQTFGSLPPPITGVSTYV